MIIKAALTHQQTQELNLHEGQMAKEESARYERFVDAYGDRCWELEAVPNDTLQEVFEGTIRRTIDLDAFEAELEKETEEKDNLDTYRGRVLDLLEDVEI